MQCKTKRILAFFLAIISIISCVIVLKTTGMYSVYTYSSNKRDLPIYCVDRKDSVLSISFDCAWGVEYTDKILDTLDFYKVKCTFFMTQFWVEKNPEYVEKIFERGHEIGTHSRTHPYMSKMNKSEIESELKTSKEAIEKITGRKVDLFRPPYGDYDDLLVSTAREMGIYTIQWSVDSLDWKDLSALEIATRVLQKAKSGSIILCHNNGLHTAEALPLIFSALQEKGFVFQPIGALIYKEGYTVDHSGMQIKN
ncbi:MAG: polysaccharide deacetylase family protein [Clostridia bacterium]|nr:polysaccharide deacetylase family protein [Clostridia bacterium]